MQIIISHSKIKRVINGPFSLCGNGRDLFLIAKCITTLAHNEEYYGWIDVYDKPEVLVNTPPIDWDDGLPKPTLGEPTLGACMQCRSNIIEGARFCYFCGLSFIPKNL